MFENNDFSGKKLVPFSTHEGSGLSGFDRKLAAACPGSEILDGLAVRGNDAQNRQEQVRDSWPGLDIDLRNEERFWKLRQNLSFLFCCAHSCPGVKVHAGTAFLMENGNWKVEN